jgi:hypothetical protein
MLIVRGRESLRRPNNEKPPCDEKTSRRRDAIADWILRGLANNCGPTTGGCGGKGHIWDNLLNK